METQEAELLSSFLLPMLEVNPARRISAAEALEHPWVKDLNVDKPVMFSSPLKKPKSSKHEEEEEEGDEEEKE